MDTLRRTFFEDPLYVYIALAFAELVLAAVWYERRTRRALALLAVPVVLAGGAFLLERAVQTDREVIVASAREMAEGLSAGDFEPLERYVSRDFHGPLGSRDAVLARSRRVIDRYELSAVEVRSVEVTVEGEQAVMTGGTVVEGGYEGATFRTLVGWEIDWVREPDGVWRIVAARPDVNVP